ncbi:MAG: D-glycero-alpha-D-manno-heptose-1,7-bisphosphate 7-phosphatase [Thermoanaerobaculia bacterium]
MRDWPPLVAPRFRNAVFLDRDGTINIDTHYPYKVEDLEFLPGALQALVALADLPAHIIVVSNQAGIALGMYTRDAMSAFNHRLRHIVENAGGRIDAFYYCPHREQKDLAPGERPCPCSKPAPGMLLEASADFRLDLSHSVLAGDKASDVAAGTAAGCYTILVAPTNRGSEPAADFVVPDLPAMLPILNSLLEQRVAMRRSVRTA